MRENRPQRPQVVLEVQRTEWISPSLIRVVVGGQGFESFDTNDFTDRYVKIVFVSPEAGLTPPYDIPALRESLPQHLWPVVRTYTVRRVDAESRELWIDFVVHGDEGVAGPWAASARPGDTLVFSGPGGGYRPDPAADWHLLVGDESALPAIAAALEAMPADATGQVYLHASSDASIVDLDAPGFVVRWVTGESSALAEAVASAAWAAGRVQVFAHGERESMKALRDVFAGKGVERSQLSLSGYWANGRTEDRFQAEKREPIGRILD